jgi:hypothetical protein
MIHELGRDEALRRDVLLDPVDHGHEHIDVSPKTSKTLCVPHSMWTPAIRGANHNGRRTAVPLGSSSWRDESQTFSRGASRVTLCTDWNLRSSGTLPVMSLGSTSRVSMWRASPVITSARFGCGKVCTLEHPMPQNLSLRPNHLFGYRMRTRSK